jgi:hypothetical protein
MSPNGHASPVTTTCGGRGVLGGKDCIGHGGKVVEFPTMHQIGGYAAKAIAQVVIAVALQLRFVQPI